MSSGGELEVAHTCQLKCTFMLNYYMHMIIVVSKSWEKSDAPSTQRQSEDVINNFFMSFILGHFL